MQEKTSPIIIDYYSDVLCVWAWIAQPRLEELCRQWGTRVLLRHHFVDIFGDCNRKILASWGQDDGFEKFAEHVEHSAEPFAHATVHPDIWRNTRPRSSAQAHWLLRAVGLVAEEAALAATALQIRRAFFCDGNDVSDMDLLLQIAAGQGVDREAIARCFRDGSAMASLSSDLRTASESGVRGSPTWILNNGRQILYGNVGYRVLSANIEELLKHPGEEASWC
ncbi:disulfide bond formation protein DsbA [Seongchinamella sediminis]|uniref:Disulfide bond formation protein DsbA n=1 Tax=Seongchinamella sediminis TaxID=2283635 RepID=A0A3L7E1P5_9GAMM|nr:DsbA family protein [Seongchinamella sediminis]RLQ23416.1 disulfide bond formation protein DsbA [Seongchinamella sediminis]